MERAQKQFGGRLPDAIQNAPRLHEHLVLYWEAYHWLNTCRPSGGFGSPGPIPWTAIREYAEWYDFSVEQYERLLFLVGRMDKEYLAWWEQKHGNKSNSGPAGAPSASTGRRIGGRRN